MPLSRIPRQNNASAALGRFRLRYVGAPVRLTRPQKRAGRLLSSQSSRGRPPDCVLNFDYLARPAAWVVRQLHRSASIFPLT